MPGPETTPGDDARGASSRGTGTISRRLGSGAADVVRRIDRDNIVIIAAGLAFFATLSVPPLLTAIISIYGLVAEPGAVEALADSLSSFLPEGVRLLIVDQLRELIGAPRGGLGLGAAASIVTALWAGSKGVFYLFRALNVAYGEQETRGFLRLKAGAFLFTVGLIAWAVIALALLALLPALLHWIGLGGWEERLVSLGRWPLLVGGLLLVLALLYHFGPDCRRTRWRWITPGAVLVTVAWTAMSLAFSTVVEASGKFNETYGALGAGMALLVWFFATAFLVLLGAEVNAQRKK